MYIVNSNLCLLSELLSEFLLKQCLPEHCRQMIKKNVRDFVAGFQFGDFLISFKDPLQFTLLYK